MKTDRLLVFGLIGLIAAAAPAARAGWYDAIAHTAIEFIAGGPVRETDRQYQGTRHVADPKEWVLGPARRTMESVFGVSIIRDENRERESSLDSWDPLDSMGDREFQQSTAAARVGFLPSGQIEIPTGTSTLNTSQGALTQEEDWWTKKLAAVNPTFLMPALSLLTQRAVQAQLGTALAIATDGGAALPKFTGQEHPQPTASPAPGQPTSGLQDRITAPSSVTKKAAELTLEIKPAAITSNLDAGPAASSPDIVLPSFTDPAAEQQRVRSAIVRRPNSDEAADAAAFARNTIPLGRETTEEGIQLLANSALAASDVLFNFLTTSIQNLIQNNGGGLGSQFSPLSNLFSPGRFADLLGNRFGSGQQAGDRGGGGRAPDPVPSARVQRPFAGACTGHTPTLSEQTVRDIAYLLGLPDSASGPWVSQIRPIVNPQNPRLQIANTRGTNPENQQLVTLTAADFPGEQCAWVVIATGQNQIVVMSDAETPGAVRVRLVLQ